MNSICFDESLFNDLKNKIIDLKTRFIISYGSAGSGKSVTQAQIEIIKCLQNKEKVLIIRKYGTTLKDSVVSLVIKTLDDWGLNSLYTHNKSDQHIRFATGSEMLFKGFDDPEKIKSIDGITRVWIEEATELTKEDFNQLNLRVRGRDNLQLTLTFNPVDEDHWIKHHFFDTPEINQNTTIIQTTYKDNKFIDEAYKQQLESYALIDPNYYKIYALGQWGGLTEGRVFKSWDECDIFPYVDGAWYGLDFGFSNDPTAIVKTIKMNSRIYFDEICYQTGLTNSDIAALLKSQGYAGEMVVCDSAEPKSIEELRRFGIKAVPADKGKGSIMAGIDYLRRSNVVITKRSHNIRKENRYYQYQQTKDGRFINIPKDFMNHCFSSDTIVSTSNGGKQIKDIDKNDLILTSHGYDKIITNGITGHDEIVVYIINIINFEVELKCTSNHLIYTSEGWIQISHLTPGMTVFLNRSLTGECLDFTQEKDISVVEESGFIGLYGKKIMDQYLKDSIFTTKTKTHSIIQSIILNLLRMASICQNMVKEGLKKTESGLCHFKQKVFHQQLIGIKVKPDQNGTNNMLLSKDLELKHTEQENAQFVIQNTKQQQHINYIAQTNVKVDTEEITDSTISSSYAPCVGLNLQHQNTAGNIIALPFVVQSVGVKSRYKDYTWDLTMLTYPEFFANGLLVHNCIDSMRYSHSYNFKVFETKSTGYVIQT